MEMLMWKKEMILKNSESHAYLKKKTTIQFSYRKLFESMWKKNFPREKCATSHFQFALQLI